MNDLKKIVTILIRLQSLSFMLLAVTHWGIVATSIIIASLDQKRVANYEIYLAAGIFYLIIGLILYGKSKSLAGYFISGVKDDESSATQD